MFRKLFGLMVLIITVLTVNLVTGFITSLILHFGGRMDPYKFTAYGMFGLVFILVPAYGFLSERIQVLTAKVLLSGGNTSFGRIIGVLVTFALVFVILFAIYLHEWFGLNLFWPR